MRALEEAQAQMDSFGFVYANKDDKVFKFYTALSVQDFKNLLHVIGKGAEKIDYSGITGESYHGQHNHQSPRKLSHEDELFLTLCKLRHDFPESDLATRFHVSQPTISRIFRTWVSCPSYSFQEINIWPSKSAGTKLCARKCS